MDEEDVAISIMGALQELARMGRLPVAMVTGFTLAVEGIDNQGEDLVITACGPDDYITKTLGHIDYLRIKMEQIVADNGPFGSE